MARFLSNVRRNGLLVLIGLFYLYLALHAVSGSQGMFKLAQYEGQKTDLQEDIVAVKAHRLTLERKAEQLRSSSLNLDTVDEQARRLTGASHVNDIVIILDN